MSMPHTHHLILGGDLSCVIDPSFDRSQSKSTTPTAMSKTLSAFMDQIGCVDPWCFSHTNPKDLPYFSTGHQVYSRVDYFFY